jgi:hypothetical protein
MLFVRFCCALLSAFIFTMYISVPAFLLWSIRCDGFKDTVCDEEYVWLTKFTFCFQIVAACLWIATWAYLEIMASRQSTRQKPRLLTHLRYGPIAVVVLSLALFFYYDVMMTQYSRWQIVRYIHSNTSPWEPPNFHLYSNYRGFCVYGIPVHRYALYGATPAKYFDHPDPLVRARALKASIYINPGDALLANRLKKAMADENPLVRQIAAEYYSELWASPHY